MTRKFCSAVFSDYDKVHGGKDGQEDKKTRIRVYPRQADISLGKVLDNKLRRFTDDKEK